MNKKRRVAQMKSHRRKEALKERAKESRPAASRTAVLPARTKYEIEETDASPVKAVKLKAAAPKKVEKKPEVKEVVSEAKPKAAARPKKAAPEAGEKPKAAKKPAAAKTAKAE
jgi:hypothetical protein